jgi:hypothetical protein
VAALEARIRSLELIIEADASRIKSLELALEDLPSGDVRRAYVRPDAY